METESPEVAPKAQPRLKVSEGTLRNLIELRDDIATMRHRDRAQFATAGVLTSCEGESGSPMDGAGEPTPGSAGG